MADSTRSPINPIVLGRKSTVVAVPLRYWKAIVDCASMKQGPLQAEGLDAGVEGGFPLAEVTLQWSMFPTLTMKPLQGGPLVRPRGAISLKAIAPPDALGDVLLRVKSARPAINRREVIIAVAFLVLFTLAGVFKGRDPTWIDAAAHLTLAIVVGGIALAIRHMLVPPVNAAAKERYNQLLHAIAQWTDRGSMPDYGCKAPDARDWRP